MHLYGYRISACNLSRGVVLGNAIRVAESGLSRMVGLLGERQLAPGDGLLIVPSQGVHTLGMLFSIDIVVLDNDWKVLDVRKRMRPFMVTRVYFKAAVVLELPTGTVAQSGTCIGDSLQFARIEER
jgi:uncharacterized protein